MVTVTTGMTVYMCVQSTSSLKQHSMDRHVLPLAHIILISSQLVFALSR